ncbi:MAG: LysR substrate-binding domain-containing protein [Halopseudomonas aestusnigri]
MRSPNLNSLKMFDAAARHLNFRLAAEELNLTQGAVAQQVRRLESDLQIQFFHRRPRGLELTQIGQEYHLSIRRALAIIDVATTKLQPINTRITVSVPPSFAAKWLVPRLSQFSQAYPDIDLQTDASEKVADFRTDDVDIAIRQGTPPFGAAPLDDDLQIEQLSPFHLCAVCNPDLAAVIGPVEELHDLAEQPLIQDRHFLWTPMLEQLGISASKRILQFNQTALAMDAAANGQGVTLAPQLLVTTEETQGRLVSLWQDIEPSVGGYYLLYPTFKAPNPARDSVVQWLITTTQNCTENT